jgi:cell division protein FtsB
MTSRGRRRLLAAGILAVAGYYAVLGGEYSALHLVRLRQEHAAAELHLAAVRAEADSLKAMAALLENDDATIERVARERFGMIAEGELLYRFVPVDSGVSR